MERCLTEQCFTIILRKKQMDIQYWPRLQKAGAVLPCIRTDFKRSTWEGDQSDVIINAKTDIDSLGTNNAQDSRKVIMVPTRVKV